MPGLDRCARVVISAVPFFGAGVTITVTHRVSLPEGHASRRTQCSVTSTLPLAVRRGIWQARERKGTLDYLDGGPHLRAAELERPACVAGNPVAANANETPEQAHAWFTKIRTELERAGETDAAAFVRQEFLRRANIATMGYEHLRRLLIGDEPKIDRALDKAYRAAHTDEGRLDVRTPVLEGRAAQPSRAPAGAFAARVHEQEGRASHRDRARPQRPLRGRWTACGGGVGPATPGLR